MTHPIRIQRRRTPGFRLQAQSPDGRPVVYVGRPTMWGNPFTIKAAMCAGYTRHDVVAAFADWLDGDPWACPSHDHYEARRAEMLARRLELRDKHLACFCPLGCPCHADVLLELANR